MTFKTVLKWQEILGFSIISLTELKTSTTIQILFLMYLTFYLLFLLKKYFFDLLTKYKDTNKIHNLFFQYLLIFNTQSHSSSFCFTFFLIESELFSSSAIGETNLFSGSFPFSASSAFTFSAFPFSAEFPCWVSTTGFASSSDSMKISTGC